MSTMSIGTLLAMLPWYRNMRQYWSHEMVLTEALIADIKIPKVNPQIVGRYVRLAVRVDGDWIDMISMRIRIDFPWDGSNNVILTDDGW